MGDLTDSVKRKIKECFDMSTLAREMGSKGTFFPCFSVDEADRERNRRSGSDVEFRLQVSSQKRAYERDDAPMVSRHVEPTRGAHVGVGDDLYQGVYA